MGPAPSKVVKFTGFNGVMTGSELRNVVYQRCLAGVEAKSDSQLTHDPGGEVWGDAGLLP
jgi:hypothetical protein